MATHFPALSVTVGQRRWPCVLDPALLLSRYGLMLARHLSEVMELWVVRELWHILDNTHFYRRQPQLLLPDNNQGEPAEEELAQALSGWEQARLQTDLGGLKLFWVGDGPTESLLPPGADPRLTWRCEALSRALDQRLSGDGSGLLPAFRDAAALTATLGSALILAVLPAQGAPALCEALNGWGIPCSELDSNDVMVELEREQLRRILVYAGLAKLWWAGLRMAALHLVLPPSRLDPGQLPEEDHQEENGLEPEESELWNGARGFWYPL